MWSLEADQEWQQQRAGEPGHGPQQAHHHQPHGGHGPGGLRSCPPQRGEAEVLRREAAEEPEHGDGDGEGPVPVDDDLEAAGVRGRGEVVGDEEHPHQQHPHHAQHRAQPPPRLAWEWSCICLPLCNVYSALLTKYENIAEMMPMEVEAW